MTDNRLGYIYQRTYTRVVNDQTETVYVNVGADGYIRMTAKNLDQILQHLNYTETTKEPHQ